MMTVPYNQTAAENGWPELPENPGLEDAFIDEIYGGTTIISCQVVQMIDKTYGKMPEDEANNQVMMELSYYMDYISAGTSLNKTYYTQEQEDYLMNWLASTPNMTYQFVN